MNVQLPLISAGGNATYVADLHAWALAQACLLREVRPDGVDWENIAEEIESLGKDRDRELRSRLKIIIEHLLKYEHGRNRDPANGWAETLLEQRQQIGELFIESPSLRRKTDIGLDGIFAAARKKTLASFRTYESGQIGFYEGALPKVLPYGVDDLLDEDFLPQPPL